MFYESLVVIVDRIKVLTSDVFTVDTKVSCVPSALIILYCVCFLED